MIIRWWPGNLFISDIILKVSVETSTLWRHILHKGNINIHLLWNDFDSERFSLCVNKPNFSRMSTLSTYDEWIVDDAYSFPALIWQSYPCGWTSLSGSVYRWDLNSWIVSIESDSFNINPYFRHWRDLHLPMWEPSLVVIVFNVIAGDRLCFTGKKLQG